MAESKKRIHSACPRCQGRMFPESESGDLVCFMCGNIVYAVAPADLVDVRERPASRNGMRLN